MTLTNTRLLGMTGLIALIAGVYLLVPIPFGDCDRTSAPAYCSDAAQQAGNSPASNRDDAAAIDASTNVASVVEQRVRSRIRQGDESGDVDPANEASRSDESNTADTAARSGDTVPIPASPAPNSAILSQRVFKVIQEVQNRFTDQQIEEGLNELNALYEDYEQLNDFEKATVLNFYSNALLAYRMLPEATAVFEKLLTVDNLSDDIRSRALRSLGQLNMAQDNYSAAINYFNELIEVSATRDTAALLGLANAHYALQQYDQAIPLLVEHIQGLLTEGKAVDKAKIGLLATMATQTQDGELLAMVKEFLASQTTPAPNQAIKVL